MEEFDEADIRRRSKGSLTAIFYADSGNCMPNDLKNDMKHFIVEKMLEDWREMSSRYVIL